VKSQSRTVIVMLLYCAAVFVWSAIHPYTYKDWFFEICVGSAGILLLAVLWRRFPFSTLAYVLASAHFTILAIGAKYTYALNPWFERIKEAFDLSRNHFDRVGHFAQGFVPAILARELILRTSTLKRGKWLFFLVVCFCLAFSAFYELLEWWIVLLWYGSEGEQWLGTQGDVWDPQADMFMATIGAILSLTLLSKLHDRSMKRLGVKLDDA
jgi:putative membrane protein